MPEYSVTKAAVLSLSRLVADLYAGGGIRCNAVCPGPTLTPAWLAIGGLADQTAARLRPQPRRRAEAVGAGRPLGRMAEPAEIAAVIAFLCSPQAALRHRRGLERRRRHVRDHHLDDTTRDGSRCDPGNSDVADDPSAHGPVADRLRRAHRRHRGDVRCRRWPCARTRRRAGCSPRTRSARCARRSSATATGSSTASRSAG